MELREVRLLGLFYISHFFSTALNATEAIWVVYMMSKGFTFTQIGLNFAVFAISRFIFEVPTGAVADVFGRKLSTVLGWVFTGVLFFMLPFIDSFSTWIVIVFLSAIPYTMISGASDAWAVDWLKRKGASELAKNYFANIETIRNLSFAIAGVVGTVLLSYFSMDSIFYAVAVGFILAGGILVFQEEYFRKAKTAFKSQVLNSLHGSTSGLKLTWADKNLRYLTLSTFFLSLSAVGWVAWEPLFLQTGIELRYFPLIMTAAFLFSSFASFFSKRIVLRFKDEKKYLIVTSFLMSVSHILAFIIVGPIAAVTFFILKNGFFSFRYPVKQDLLHELIPSKLRATLASVDSMYDAFSVAIAAVFGGLILDNVGVTETLLAAGLLMLPSALLSGMLSLKAKGAHNPDIGPAELKDAKVKRISPKD